MLWFSFCHFLFLHWGWKSCYSQLTGSSSQRNHTFTPQHCYVHIGSDQSLASMQTSHGNMSTSILSENSLLSLLVTNDFFSIVPCHTFTASAIDTIDLPHSAAGVCVPIVIGKKVHKHYMVRYNVASEDLNSYSVVGSKYIYSSTVSKYNISIWCYFTPLHLSISYSYGSTFSTCGSTYSL